MQGILFVVATPIGNLEDVSFRALRVLREVELIAAEDTRRTARLLQHYSIPTPTTSLHEHNERSRVPGLIQRLKQGQSIALVSDAGTPVVSDPGAHLITAAHQSGIRVEPVPGPNAAITALSASGIPASEFLFVGFPPARSNARKRWLLELVDEPRPVVMYEAPHRIHGLLTEIARLMPRRTVTIARELTKAHEQLVVRPIKDVDVQAILPRGEFTVVLHPVPSGATATRTLPDEAVLLREFGELTNNNGLDNRQAVERLARKYGSSTNALYRRLVAGKK
ncbi:MAG: 16S rRNA (cytidine(1402)-2'-O)-methyltransferase [Vicinamibacterales bacterium]